MLAPAVAAVNHVYANTNAPSSEREDIPIEEQNTDTETGRERTKSESEAIASLDQLSDRLNKEDQTFAQHETNNNDTATNNHTNGNAVYANLDSNDERVIPEDTGSSLMQFPEYENCKEADNNQDAGEADEEPNPDYDIKAVRFHTEVLDADENKLQPLKIKEEEEPENEQMEDGRNENIDSSKQHNETLDHNQSAHLVTPDISTTFKTSVDEDGTGDDNVQEDSTGGEKAEEEIEFYFGEESTHF